MMQNLFCFSCDFLVFSFAQKKIEKPENKDLKKPLHLHLYNVYACINKQTGKREKGGEREGERVIIQQHPQQKIKKIKALILDPSPSLLYLYIHTYS